MTKNHTALVLCKRQDFNILQADNVVYENGRFTLKTIGYTRGELRLFPIDSSVRGFQWGRLTLHGEFPSDSMLITKAFASDSDETPEPHMYVKAGDLPDMLLRVCGRRLWLMFEFISAERGAALEKISVHISGDHMIDYLPAIYRAGDGFTRRFVSVFDSVAADIERDVDRAAALVDYKKAGGDGLRRLAEWICVEPAENELDTAARIETAFDDFTDRYTIRGIKRSVERLLGHSPIILEYADVDPNNPACPDSALYRRLYGDNPYIFFIMLDETVFAREADKRRFSLRMRSLIPADTDFFLVTFYHKIQLGGHCYLGINSYIGGYTPAAVDLNMALHYDTTVEKSQ